MDIDVSRRQYLAAAAAIGGGAWLVDDPTSGGVAFSDSNARDQAIRPVVGGVYLTPEGIDKWGTLGVGVEYDGSPAVVTNRHVVDDGSDEEPSEVVGRTVYQPSREDGAIGDVVAASTIGGAGSSDWAIVGLDRAINWTTFALGVGEVATTAPVSEGDRVVIDGARTGLLGGEVSRVGVDANFRGELYNGMIEYVVDENRDTAGDSGGVVATIDSDGTVRPIGLHTFAIDEYRFAIQWGDLPSAVDASAQGVTPEPPAVGPQVEGVIYGRDSAGMQVRVSNLGDAVADRTVVLRDPASGDVVDSVAVSLEALAQADVVLDPAGRDRVILEVGSTRVATEITL